MNFMDRKLFKPRPARDKLNQMGGIMASSRPLMQTVQTFQQGGGVSPFRMTGNPTLTGGPIVNRPPIIPAYPGIVSSTANRQIPVTTPTVAGSPSVRASQAATPLNEGLSSLVRDYIRDPIDRVRDVVGAQFVDSPGNVQRRQFLMTEGPQAELRSKLEEQGYDLSGDQRYSVQPSTVPGGEEARSGAISEDILEDTRLSPKGDEMFRPQMLGDVSPSPGTSGEEEKGFTVITGEEQATTKSGVPKPAPAPVSVTASGLNTTSEAIKKTTEELASFLGNPNVSEQEKNRTLLEQFGVVSPEEEIKGLKKQAELNAQLYREIAGVDPEEDKKIDGYNLAMMGFLIAAGDSPDALQNIAQGMAKGTSMMMDTKKARQERDRQFKIAGLDKAIKDDETRKQLAIDAYNKTEDRRFSLLTDQLKDQRQQQTVMLQLAAREKMLIAELNAKQEMAQADNISAENRELFRAQAAVLEKQVNALGSVGALALTELGIGDALEGSNFGDKVQEILNDPTKLSQAETIAGMGGTTKTGPPAMTPERYAQNIMLEKSWVERNTYAAIETLQAQGIEEPTQNQIETELRNRAAQQATTPITGGAAAPSAQTRPTVTTQAEYDALAPGAEFIQNGQVRRKPAQ